MRLCKACNFLKPEEKFGKAKDCPDGINRYCRLCALVIGQVSRDRKRAKGLCHCGRVPVGKFKLCATCRKRRRDWGARWPEKDKAIRDNQRREKRRIVFEHYGNKCACCGESRREFLSIDHKNGDGGKQRFELNRYGGLSFDIWIIRNGFPDDLQILCYNCNCAKGFFGYCPHEKERQEAAAQLASPVVELEKVSPDLSQCMASPNS